MKNIRQQSGGIDDLKNRLQWLMFFRIIIASFFLGVVAITQLQRSDSYLTPYLVRIYSLTGSIYLLTFIYILILPLIKKLKIFAYIQIMIDVLLISLSIFFTGGINSMFSFMYSLSIISASILLYIFGGIITATVSSLLYSLLISLQHYGLISPIQTDLIAKGYSDETLFYPIIVNIAAFYLVALLSSFLSEQARESRIQLQEKQLDIENLEVFNKNIIQSINSGLLTLDDQNRIITFNQTAQEITGLLHLQVYKKNIEEVFPGIILPKPPEATENKRILPRFEISYKREDGTFRYLGFSLSTLKNNQGLEIGKILIFQDLTNIKQMQDYIQRVDRLAAIGRLAAGIAHEVRNPLASISGSIQVLKKSLTPNDSDKRLMEIIIRESKNLSLLISDFTEFARPGKNKKERVKLKCIVDDVVDIFKNSPECKKVLNIRRDIRDDIFIHANYHQFKQVFWNLMINASQATDNGASEITISARIKKNELQPLMNINSLREGNHENIPSSGVEIQVEDTGCGIEELAMDKIFDPFYTTKDRGIGLGLSIVHKIIQEHGGTITVKSIKGKGTTFGIYLPL